MTSDRGGAVGLVIASALFVAALLEPSMAWFGVPALIGGALLGGLLLYTHQHHAFSHLEDTTDGANVGSQQPMFNMSSVKPTGIGGLLLAAMAVFAAARYPQGRALILFGILGGSVVAAALIKMHRPVPVLVRQFQVPASSNPRRNGRN